MFLMIAVVACMRGGRRELAEAFHQELVARSRTEYIPHIALAIAAAHLGNTQEGLKQLREAAQIREPLLAAIILRYKALDILRAEPAYAEILASLGW
jgi:hypothetical protein